MSWTKRTGMSCVFRILPMTLSGSLREKLHILWEELHLITIPTFTMILTPEASDLFSKSWWPKWRTYLSMWSMMYRRMDTVLILMSKFSFLCCLYSSLIVQIESKTISIYIVGNTVRSMSCNIKGLQTSDEDISPALRSTISSSSAWQDSLGKRGKVQFNYYCAGKWNCSMAQNEISNIQGYKLR